LTTAQTQWIDTIYQASRRMSRLNQGLLLLAKIENRQFVNSQAIDLTDELILRLKDMDEVLLHKQISTNILPGEAFWARLPPLLADSLLTNLLSNAIRHNQLGGRIEVRSSAYYLQLKNTGPAPTVEPEALFKRFKKGSSSNETVGLGLAIVKQICDTYQLTISYQYEEGMHTLSLAEG
jgi:signal transduction histidine kinase